ncbi:MAG: MFS transporter, partial [Nocardioidaceae bacterium]
RSDDPDGDTRDSARWVVLAVMCVGYFLVLLDVTIVNVALPRIGAGLGTQVGGLQWVVDGYAITLASLLLAGGSVGDVRGHKRVVLVGLAVFAIASLGCALAPGITVLIVARVLQGVGAALLLPGTLAIISHAFPEGREQARAIGVWAGVGGSALPAGPVLGGALVQGIGWRAVFFVNVPIALVAGAVVLRVVRESREPAARRADPAGIALGGLALAATTFAFIRSADGVDVVVAGAAATAVVLVPAFGVVERYRSEPMLPLELFGRPGFSSANAVAGAMNLGTLGLLFVLTLYLQTVQGRDPLAAGVALLPLFVPLGVLAPLAGRVTARVGPRPPMVAGLTCAAVGAALLVRLRPDSAYATVLPAMLLWGIGMGLLTPAVVSAAIRSVPPDRAGLASGVNNTARQAGGAIGIAAYGALAGSPSSPGTFTSGLHLAGIATAVLWVAAAIVTLALVPAGARSR